MLFLLILILSFAGGFFPAVVDSGYSCVFIGLSNWTDSWPFILVGFRSNFCCMDGTCAV